MGIGAYRHLVTLEHPAVVTDPPTWYCALQPAGAQVGDGLAAFFIRGRFHPGITLETQINWEGRTFQVQGIADLDERHREIQITAVEVVGRGTTPTGAPVFVPPTITVGPVGATIDAGESVILTVIAVGAAPLFYQWTKDGADLPGAVYQFLETGPLETTTTYAVRVSNVYGSVLSAPAIVTVPVALTYQEQVIADGAVAYWPLDDPAGTTVRDLVGAADGTISGGVTLNQPGVTVDSQCMTFDGTTSKIEVGPMTLPKTLSVEAWVKASTVVDYKAFFTSRDASTLGIRFFGCQAFGGKATLYFDRPAVTFVEGSSSVVDGAWHHVVAVLTATAGQLFIDGVAGPLVALTLQDPASVPTYIGYDIDGHRWTGSLQDVAVYQRALTPAEILAHYQLRVPA